MKIIKFGGKSLDSIEKVQKICKNIKKIYKNDQKIIIIVSAMGSTTDDLLAKSQQYCFKKPSKRELDALLSTGETQSSALVALMLNSLGVPAKSFQGWQLELTTFGEHQNSKIAHINKRAILECFSENAVAVIAGFQGINKQNEITTLGRGGSDTTAAALGALFDHDVEIYSDFDGIFAGDPRVLNFKKIKNLCYSSIKNMARSGAKVLDAKSANIAKKFNFKIICKQSSAPAKRGTTISNIEDSFISVSTIENLTKLSINFSEDIDKLFLIKNVINSINSANFYNLTIKNDVIEFYIQTQNINDVILDLSTKLKLLKNK